MGVDRERRGITQNDEDVTRKNARSELTRRVDFSKIVPRSVPHVRTFLMRPLEGRARCPVRRASFTETEKEERGIPMSRTAKKDQVTRAKQLILGTGKHYPNGAETLHVGGATFTVTELTKSMQDFVDSRAAVEGAKAALKTKIEAERTQAPSRIAVIAAFERLLRGLFGTSADVLADFGLALPKARVPLTAEQKAVAAAKRDATRKARGTMGKVQRKKVKGAVTAALVVTPVSGSPPTVATPGPGPVTTPAQATPPAPAPATGPTPHAT
jgi:hypothetical protein